MSGTREHAHQSDVRDHHADSNTIEHQYAEHGGGEAHGGHKYVGHESHHAHMVADFRRRFWISLVLTVPVIVLSEVLQWAVHET